MRWHRFCSAAPVQRPWRKQKREKSGQLLGMLRKNGHMSLASMFGICKSRSELVATFLSVLELCSDGHIRVSGEKGNYDVSCVLTDTDV